ncbi:hypothetical protein ACFV0H_36495 [Streptomyces erythrochromogenes]|uniref:hypothetical protein n=1 Tax=Streptomyces erythrochromogenes TaxID=285574 RepID=UPI0036C412EA
MDTTDTDLLNLVTGGLSPLGLPEDRCRARAGECLYRDLASRIGPMPVLIPRDRAIERVIHTTPTTDRPPHENPSRPVHAAAPARHSPPASRRVRGGARRHRVHHAHLAPGLGRADRVPDTHQPADDQCAPTPGTRTPTPEELAEIEKIIADLNKRFSEGMQEAYLKAELGSRHHEPPR